jgi:hypothetical protein
VELFVSIREPERPVMVPPIVKEFTVGGGVVGTTGVVGALDGGIFVAEADVLATGL